jgi:glycosyltransferase involved in cell wall biosynthesis
MNAHAGAVFISFDAVAVSGITVEAVKIARSLKRSGIRCYLDLGYDIKIDKGHFNKPYDAERELYRDVFTLVRIEGIDSVPHYSEDFLEYAHDVLIGQKTPVSEGEREKILCAAREASRELARRIVRQWESLHIAYVIVENGTLPENVIYTRALYLAIDAYGKRHDKGKFVVWRDHDLMWNSEKTAMKYGPPPYIHAVKPVKSRHITYVTLNHHLKDKLEAWCDHDVAVTVKKNTYDFTRKEKRTDLRQRLSIRVQDILIARTTRIIPQKRIDRDLHLLARLARRFDRDGGDRKVYLVVAGDPQEHPDCHRQLQMLAGQLGIASQVNYVGTLQHACMPAQNNAYTIEDLYDACDLVSFLTSWDYDSYGNPIGEAISCRRCYITSNYEYYWEVYGQYGFEAPVMATSEGNDGLPDDAFVDSVYRLLNDRQGMRELAHRNYLIGKEVLSDNIIDMFDLDRCREPTAAMGL